MEKQFAAAGGVSFAAADDGLRVTTRAGDKLISTPAEVAGALGDLDGVPLSMSHLCRDLARSPEAIVAFGMVQRLVTQFVELGLVDQVVSEGGRPVARLRKKGQCRLIATPPPASFRLSRHVVAVPEDGGMRLDSGVSRGTVWVAADALGDLLAAELSTLPCSEVTGLLWQAGLCVTQAETDLADRMWNPVELLTVHLAADGGAGHPYGATLRFAGEIDPPPLQEPDIAVRRSIPYPAPTRDLEDDPPYGVVVRSRESRSDFGDGPAPSFESVADMLRRTTTIREYLRDPYGMSPTRRYVPSGGGIHEVDVYLAVRDVSGLEPGLYRNDPVEEGLQLLETRSDPSVLVQAAGGAFSPPANPSFVALFVARFDRLLWKYEGVATSLVFKHVGILTHALHLGATVVGLGGCAQGGSSTNVFQTVTGLGFPRHGVVGQMSFGPVALDTGVTS